VYVRLAEVNKKLNMWFPKWEVYEYCTMYFHIERFKPLEQAENTREEEISTKVSLPN
jgi:hypothetical protein